MFAIRDLLAQSDLGLVGLHVGAGAASPISWASSSDLPDPTPFLVPDQLLLTTGTQFADDAPAAVFHDYVAALQRRDVRGIGFGTEVVRTTPAGLLTACREADLALVEVPYRTPFLAIIRRVARELERESRARDDWALAASRAISGAALPRGDVGAVLRELAARLDAVIVLFDADGETERSFPRLRAGAPEPEIAAEARRLLNAGSRAAAEIGPQTAPTLLQTIGPAGELGGVLAVTGASLDRAARTVLAAAVALVEVGVAEARRAARGTLARNAVLLRLLREGRGDLAAQVAEAAGAALPTGALVVVVTDAGDDRALRALAEREARAGDRLAVVDGGLLVALATPRKAAATAARLTGWGGTVGTAAVEDLTALDIGIARADAARRIAAPASALRWEDLPDAADLRVRDDALAALVPAIAATPAGAAEIAAADAWFLENCNWGAAARRLDAHPHTVRDRVTSLSRRLALDLGGFEGRARLWAILRAARAS
jgi:purine catabolism regulator